MWKFRKSRPTPAPAPAPAPVPALAPAVVEKAAPRGTHTFDDWVGATVTPSEAMLSRWSDVTTAREIAKRMLGPALGCATINAKVCAQTPLRMFRPGTAAPKFRGYKGRTVEDVRQWEYLRDFRRVGRKAALLAEQDDDVVEVIDHPAIKLMRRPNPLQTGMEWEMGRWIDKWGFGNDLHVVAFGGGVPIALAKMAPPFTRVVPSETTLIEAYLYGRAEEDMERFEAAEVMHLKLGPHWNNPYWGACPLDIVFRELDLYEFSLAAEAARWKQGGYPSGHLGLKNVTNQEQLDDATKVIERRIKGAEKAGRILVTSEGTYTQLGKTNEMGYLPGMEHIELRIEQEYGIPEALRRLNDANLAGGTLGPDMYMQFTIQPALRMDAEQLTELLLPLFGIQQGEAWFAYDDVSPVDTESIRNDTAVQVAGGVLTIDEQRARMGYEPAPGGIGAKHRIAGVVVEPERIVVEPDEQDQGVAPAGIEADPAAETVAETALNGAQVTALQGLVTDAAAGLIPVESAWSIARAAFPAVPESVLARIFKPLAGFVPEAPTEPATAPETEPTPETPPESKTAPEAATKASDGLTIGDLDPDGQEVKDDLERRLRAWYTRVADAMKVRPDGTVDLSAFDAELEAIIMPRLAELVAAGAALEDTGAEPLRLTNEQAAELARKPASLIVERTRKTTEDRIRDAIARGVEEGRPLNEVIDDLKTDLGEQAGASAERLARTETAHAVTIGKRAAWKAAGVTHVRWVLAPNACPVCDELVARTGGVVGIDEPFAQAGETFGSYTTPVAIWGPPLHPNDRCAIVAVTE